MTRLDVLLLTCLALTFAAVLRHPADVLMMLTALMLLGWGVVHMGYRAGLWLTASRAPECRPCEALMGGFAVLTAARLIESPPGHFAAVLALYAVVVVMTLMLDRIEPLRGAVRGIARANG